MKPWPLTWMPLFAVVISCAQPSGDDPLENTRRLAAEGHTTLYRNGAFQVPMTTIQLIPPGPDALDLAAEMAGLRAAQSFRESVKHAAEALDFAKAGVSRSIAAGKTVVRATEATAEATRETTRSGIALIKKAPRRVEGVIGESVAFAGTAFTAARNAGREVADGALNAGADLSGATDAAAGGLFAGAVSMARKTSESAARGSRRLGAVAKERFIKGYAMVPAKLAKRAGAVAESASLDQFAAAFRRSTEWRSDQSQRIFDIVVNTADSYRGNIGKSLRAAADEIALGGEDTGYTLAALKSLRWVLQGLLWEGAVKPAGRMTGAALGYVIVNSVAFPALVVLEEGRAAAKVAVEVAWNSTGGVYDITAPSASAAVAGVLSLGEMVGGQILAAGELAGGTAASGMVYATGKSVAAVTAGGGYVAGKSVQYVAAPLSTVGVVAGGTVVGVVAGAATAAAGVAEAGAGVVGEAGTDVLGTTTAGIVVAGGSVASAVSGAALGTYEMGKAVAMPAGYEVGAGVVLSYGTISQLGAHTVLAVADASYMVLSLEGPRWVLYAVKGSMNDGEDLPTGAIVDLESMKRAGETLYMVPASEEEIARVVESVHEELPIGPAKESVALGSGVQ